MDGCFVNTYNNGWTLAQYRDVVQDSDIDTDQEIVLDVCGCINTEIADELREYLTWLANREWTDMWQGTWAIAVIADEHEFTEHGGNIGGAWITEVGRAWLALGDA